MFILKRRWNRMPIIYLFIGIDVFLIILLFFNHYFHGVRNHKTYDLRIHVLKLESKIILKKIHNGFNFDGYDYYDKLPSYNKMVYSFKPLKLETYFTDEEIKELTGEN
jgi:uncharacterized protein (DUF1919 family)